MQYDDVERLVSQGPNLERRSSLPSNPNIEARRWNNIRNLLPCCTSCNDSDSGKSSVGNNQMDQDDRQSSHSRAGQDDPQRTNHDSRFFGNDQAYSPERARSEMSVEVADYRVQIEAKEKNIEWYNKQIGEIVKLTEEHQWKWFSGKLQKFRESEVQIKDEINKEVDSVKKLTMLEKYVSECKLLVRFWGIQNTKETFFSIREIVNKDNNLTTKFGTEIQRITQAMSTATADKLVNNNEALQKFEKFENDIDIIAVQVYEDQTASHYRQICGNMNKIAFNEHKGFKSRLDQSMKIRKQAMEKSNEREYKYARKLWQRFEEGLMKIERDMEWPLQKGDIQKPLDCLKRAIDDNNLDFVHQKNEFTTRINEVENMIQEAKSLFEKDNLIEGKGKLQLVKTNAEQIAREIFPLYQPYITSQLEKLPQGFRREEAEEIYTSANKVYNGGKHVEALEMLQDLKGDS